MNLKDYLEQEPRARERRNRNRAIANVLINTHNLSLDKSLVETLVAESLTLDRTWRKLLQDNPHLRGTDYKDKDALEQERQISLGYEVNYQQDIKTLKKLL